MRASVSWVSEFVMRQLENFFLYYEQNIQAHGAGIDIVEVD